MKTSSNLMNRQFSNDFTSQNSEIKNKNRGTDRMRNNRLIYSSF